MSQPETPQAPTAAKSAAMAHQRRRNTSPELAVRSVLHRHGMRYRVEFPLPGLPRRRADIAFPRQKVAVFVDGCFWHGCPEHATVPHKNRLWWQEKLARNVVRDRETDAHLTMMGWVVIRCWEHEAPESAANRIRHEVLARLA